MKNKIYSVMLSGLMITSFSVPNINAAYEDYTEEEIEKINSDMRSYVNEIVPYADELGYQTDRFYFPNGRYYPLSADFDLMWKDYRAYCTNIEAVSVDYDYFIGSTRSGRCLGMSIMSVLNHNGIISPSDIQEGKETLLDIEAATDFYGINDDPVMRKLIPYQVRQLAPDFQLDMYYHFAHYDKERDIPYLLDTAKKATEQGKWFLIGYDDKPLTHAVAGMGLLEGEFTLGDKTYDNCILTYDSNFVSYIEETDTMISATSCGVNSCIFVNSETYDVFVPAYFLDDCGAEFKIYTLDDYDFMNYRGVINPSYSHNTDVSSLNSVEIRSNGDYSINATRADGSEYDAKSSCGTVYGKPTKKKAYLCDGEKVQVQNTGNEAEFIADFMDARQIYCSSFNGAVNNVFKSEDEFGFDTLGETAYDVTLAFEEGCYSFAPHYPPELAATTDSDFKAVQTDRGIIVSGTNGVKCSLKTSDIIRDENGLIVSAEDNIQNENIFANRSVMISFDGDKLKYFIGESYDKEVQKGDVNCDGMIDASDASFVLQAYSDLSTGGTTYLSYSLADWDDNGIIDSSDASDILAYYASQMTN